MRERCVWREGEGGGGGGGGVSFAVQLWVGTVTVRMCTVCASVNTQQTATA